MKLSGINNPTNKILSILFLIGICFLMVGCSENKKTEETEINDTDNQNKEAIQAVIEKEFNGPDTKYNELFEEAMATQTDDMNQEEYDATLETPAYKEFTRYMEDTYSSYFTDNAYDTFIRTGAFYYSFSDEEYEINSSDIQINQSENDETFYNFTFKVIYQNENGETTEYDFDGNAIVPEKGKIGKIQFNDKEGLLEKIR